MNLHTCSCSRNVYRDRFDHFMVLIVAFGCLVGQPFNANLIYYDRVEWDKTREELTGAVRETDLDTLLAKADVLVLNLPLTHQTRFRIRNT